MEQYAFFFSEMYYFIYYFKISLRVAQQWLNKYANKGKTANTRQKKLN